MGTSSTKLRTPTCLFVLKGDTVRKNMCCKSSCLYVNRIDKLLISSDLNDFVHVVKKFRLKKSVSKTKSVSKLHAPFTTWERNF